jgi:hypothetical protein
MRAFVADITVAGSLSREVPAASIDVATAIFVLSANPPAALQQVALELKAVLKPKTGTVVVRDYAAGDLAEERLAAQGQHRHLSEHLYSRGDGTWCATLPLDAILLSYAFGLDPRSCYEQTLAYSIGWKYESSFS